MAHMVETAAYAREPAWHGVGVVVPDYMTSAEAIVTAGLDWDVVLEDMVTKQGYPVAGHKAVVRSTDHSVLGVVGDRYNPFQNKSAFEFFDQIVGQKLAMYDACGSLRKGQMIWLLAKLPETVSVKGVDVLKTNLLLYNSHDGSTALRMRHCITRVVCQNTLDLAIGEKPQGGVFYARHTGSLEDKVRAAQDLLGFAVTATATFLEQANRLASQRFLAKELDEFLEAVLLPKPENEADKVALHPRLVTQAAAITELFNGKGAGLDMKGIRGSKWAMYNAVAEFVDHERGGTRNPMVALDSAWFGSGAEMKAIAWNKLGKN